LVVWQFEGRVVLFAGSTLARPVQFWHNTTPATPDVNTRTRRRRLNLRRRGAGLNQKHKYRNASKHVAFSRRHPLVVDVDLGLQQRDGPVLSSAERAGRRTGTRGTSTMAKRERDVAAREGQILESLTDGDLAVYGDR
jgi:hypothetical protein